MTVIDNRSAGELLSEIGSRRPRIHCLTNHVAKTFTANVLLALGAIPSMSADSSEVGEFVGHSDALLLNLGTLEPSMRTAIQVAAEVASGNGLPVVLDPVFAERSTARTVFARRLLKQAPAALRCNAAEAAALGEKALAEARKRGTVIALTGPNDDIRSSSENCRIGGGDPVMAKVTAMGCALGAVIAAFLTVDGDRFNAVGSACLLFKRAGSAAASISNGPGSFVPAFLDEIYSAAQHSTLPDEVING